MVHQRAATRWSLPQRTTQAPAQDYTNGPYTCITPPHKSMHPYCGKGHAILSPTMTYSEQGLQITFKQYQRPCVPCHAFRGITPFHGTLGFWVEAVPHLAPSVDACCATPFALRLEIALSGMYAGSHRTVCCCTPVHEPCAAPGSTVAAWRGRKRGGHQVIGPQSITVHFSIESKGEIWTCCFDKGHSQQEQPQHNVRGSTVEDRVRGQGRGEVPCVTSIILATRPKDILE